MKGIAAILCCHCFRQRHNAAHAAAGAAACNTRTQSAAAAPDSDLRQPLLGSSVADHNKASAGQLCIKHSSNSSACKTKPLTDPVSQMPPGLIGIGCCPAGGSSSGGSLIRGGSGDSYVAGGSSSSSVRGMSADFVDVRVEVEGSSSSLESSCDRLSELSDADDGSTKRP